MKTEKVTKNSIKKSPKKSAPIIDVALKPAPVAAKPIETKPQPKVEAAKPVEIKAALKPVAPKTSAAIVESAKPAPTAAKASAVKTAVTTIEAKVDVGFGNRLFVRGQGAGLSWNQGAPLTCVDAKTWRWTGTAEEKLTFKLLINDAVWAKGEDVVVAPGKRAEIAPAF